MEIKIKCSAVEFASLVRKCECVSNNNYGSNCAYCVLYEICQERGNQARIEHVVFIDLVEGGAADG